MEHSDSEEEPGLTQEQMDKLAQLQDLTGIEDTQICRALLESEGWDLEGAARDHLGMQTEPNNENDPPLPPPPVNQVPNLPPGGNVGGGVMWRRPPLSRLLNLFMFVMGLPLRLVTSSVQQAIDLLSGMFGVAPSPVGASINPVQDVRRFYKEFEDQYGVEHPPFFTGSYAQVLEEAKKELKFLLIYLHSEEHQDSDRFCVNTLCNPQVVDYARNNLLFWGCSVSRPEGYRVSEALRESTYPFLAVIVLRQNRMVVVGRQEGNIEPASLVEWLEKTVRDYEAFIVAARADRDERNFNREIRSEQEAAFEETLRQDQELETRRVEEEQRQQAEEDEKQRVEEEARQTIEAEHQRKNEIARQKLDLVSEIPEEPDQSSTEAIRILIKLPEGQRLERRFLSTHSLKHIYYFVFCHPASPDEFDIVTNFPRRTLACKPTPEQPEPPTLGEAGFGRSEMLFVNDLQA